MYLRSEVPSAAQSCIVPEYEWKELKHMVGTLIKSLSAPVKCMELFKFNFESESTALSLTAWLGQLQLFNRLYDISA